METRPYDPATDFDAVVRIWLEAGWIDDEPDEIAGVARFLTTPDAGGAVVVAPAAGEVEAMTAWLPGTYRWLDHDLPFGVISAVLTGRAGRRRGFATATIGEALSQMHDHGVAVAALGVFEHGYYDRFGFATGAYDHEVTFDPKSLTVPFPDRHPVRVGADDHAEIYGLLRRQHLEHGGVVIDSPSWVEAEMGWIDKAWGLGFRDAQDGRLTSFVLGRAEAENGPYSVEWLAFEQPSELIELLGAIKTLSDQVQVVRFDPEPSLLRIQDLIDAPLRQYRAYRLGGRAMRAIETTSWQQERILDVQRCLEVISWTGDPFAVNFSITDPLAERDSRWAGVGDVYGVEFAPTTTVARKTPVAGGSDVEIGIGALTQIWTGARRPASLHLTGELVADQATLATLEQIFRVPRPWSSFPF